MPRRFLRRSIGCGLTLVILAASALGGEQSFPVRVTLWEGLPKTWNWQAPRAAPSDELDAPALGFVRLPAKYNARGIEIDRSSPFALHAEATLQKPAGPY